MIVIALSGQSMIDVAIQEYGSFEAVFVLAADNDLSPTDKLTPGQKLIVKQENILNKRVVEFCSINKIQPASALKEDLTLNSGIGFWEIENDFIVS